MKLKEPKLVEKNKNLVEFMDMKSFIKSSNISHSYSNNAQLFLEWMRWFRGYYWLLEENNVLV